MSTPPPGDDDDAADGDVRGASALARKDETATTVDDSGAARDDDAARAEALFRYGVIAPLCDVHEYGSLRTRITALAGERHLHPRRGEITISDRTLWTWLTRFRTGSIDALRPRHRNDRGSLRAASRDVLDRAEALRRQLPKRWTSTVIDILVREGSLEATETPHRARFDRHLRRRGASRQQLVVLGAKPTIKMRFDAFGDLWVGDYHHGPKVLAPDGRLTTAKLGAFSAAELAHKVGAAELAHKVDAADPRTRSAVSPALPTSRSSPRSGRKAEATYPNGRPREKLR